MVEKESFITRIKETLSGLLTPRQVLAFASLLLVAAFSVMFFRQPAMQNDFTVKGSAFYRLWVNGAEASGQPISVRPGDTLQLGVTAKGPMYYSIMYQDDNGPLRSYRLEENNGSGKIGKPGNEFLPHSIVLNSGWKNEVLYCVLSEVPLTPENAVIFIQRHLKNELNNDRIIIQRYLLSNP